MPQVVKVKKCRKSPGMCQKCGTAIEKGLPYVYWEPYNGPKYVRCGNPLCYPRPSDVVGSPYQSQLLAVEERIHDVVVDSANGLAEELSSSASGIENLGEECQGSLDNMPEGLQQGNTGELLQQRVEFCQELASQLYDAAENVRSAISEYEDSQGLDDLVTACDSARDDLDFSCE